MENIKCEICKQDIIGEPIYFEDGLLIHPENENLNCLKDAEKQEFEMYPDK
jgi:hypothetical protein